MSFPPPSGFFPRRRLDANSAKRGPRVRVVLRRAEEVQWAEDSLGAEVFSASAGWSQAVDVLVSDIDGVRAFWGTFAGDPKQGWPGVVLVCRSAAPGAPDGDSSDASRDAGLGGGSRRADPRPEELAQLLASIVDDVVYVGCSPAELRRRIANVAALRAARMQHRRAEAMRSIVRALLGPSLSASLTTLGLGAELLRDREIKFEASAAVAPLARAATRTQIVVQAITWAVARLECGRGQPSDPGGREQLDLVALVEQLRRKTLTPGRLRVKRGDDHTWSAHCSVYRALVQALVLTWADGCADTSRQVEVRVVADATTVELVLRCCEREAKPQVDPAARCLAPSAPQRASDRRAFLEFVADEHDALCEITSDATTEARVRFPRTPPRV